MIVIGVTGGIAAYKTCSVVSYLTGKGHDVHVVMTESAKKFVGPITFASLSRNPVIDEKAEWTPDGEINHIDYSKSVLFVVVPATANTIAKMAHGIADNVLTSMYLAHRSASVLVFPAMNNHMYENKATQDNLETLRMRGNRILGPAEGRLACGDTGKGKLLSTKDIIKNIEVYYKTYTTEKT